MVDTNAMLSGSMPVLYVRGTHYQVGAEMGRTFKSRIQEYCDQSKSLNELFLPYYGSDEGRKVYEEYLGAMMECHPQYEDELRGISDGSGVEYYKIFLVHISAELNGLLGKPQTSGCSDFMLNYVDQDGKQHSILAHNEDGDKLVLSLAYVVYAHVKPDPELYPDLPTEDFVAYTYPGRLPGNAASANGHGVTWSNNIIFPKIVGRKRTAYFTMIRALLGAQSLEHAEAIIANDPLGCSYGFCVNVAQRRPGSSDIPMANIEVAPRISTSSPAPHVLKLPLANSPEQGFAFHFNMYQHLTGIEEHEDQSTIKRKIKATSLSRPTDLPSLLAFLGNRDHAVFPIYRNGTPPDNLATLATCVSDLVAGTYSIYTGNPANGAKPLVSLPFPQSQQ